MVYNSPLFLEGEAWIDKTLGKMSDTCSIILYNNNDLIFISVNDNAVCYFTFSKFSLLASLPFP